MKQNILLKKLCSLLLAAGMLTAAFSGCGSPGAGSESVPSEESSKAVSEASEPAIAAPEVPEGEIATDEHMTEYQQGQGDPVTLNVFFQGSLDISTYGSDRVSQKLTEKTGVTLKFDVVPNDEGAKLNLLISSDQLPDLICTSPGSSQGVTLMKEDKVWKIDELFGEYAPNALKGTLFTSNNMSVYALLQQGACYGVPSTYTDRNKMDDGVFINQAPGYYVRQDLLDAVGMPEVKTLADLETALLKIQDSNPELKHSLFLWDAANFWNVNSGVNVLYYSMGGKGPYLNDNGTLQCAVRDPKFKDVILYVNKLYNQGLVNSSDFTDTYDTQNTINNQDTWAVAAGQMWHVIVPHDSFEPEGKSALPIDPIAEEGVTYEAPNGVMNGGNILYVSKSTQYPDRCAWLLEYLLTDEGQLLVTAGEETIDWEWGGPEEKWIVPIGEAKSLLDQNFSDWSKGTGAYKYILAAQNYYDSALSWGMAADSPFKQDVYEKEIHGIDVTEYVGINPEPGSDGEAVYTKIETMMKNMIAQACTAPDQAAASEIYEQFLSEADGLGLRELEETWTSNYAKNQEIMNSVK